MTFSVSVAPETKRTLQQIAAKRFGGNVSAVIESVVVEAQRQEALEWLLERAPPMADEELEAFMRELRGEPEPSAAPTRGAKKPTSRGRSTSARRAA